MVLAVFGAKSRAEVNLAASKSVQNLSGRASICTYINYRCSRRVIRGIIIVIVSYFSYFLDISIIIIITYY